MVSQDTKISAKELIDGLPKSKDEIYRYFNQSNLFLISIHCL